MNRRIFLKNSALVSAGIGSVGLFGIISTRDMWRQFGRHSWVLDNFSPCFGSIIVSRTVGGVEDKRISLSNSNFGRAIPAGVGTWSSLRVGIRFSAYGSTNPTTGVAISFGLCSGTSHLWLDATTTNAIGINTTNVGAPRYVAASGGNMAFLGDLRVYASKRVAGTTTDANGYDYMYLPADPTVETRRMLMVQITKGTPNFTVARFWCSGATASPDVTKADFLGLIEGAGSPSFTNHTFDAAKSVAFSEGDGTLDTIFAAWNRSAQTIEICDLAISKLA